MLSNSYSTGLEIAISVPIQAQGMVSQNDYGSKTVCATSTWRFMGSYKWGYEQVAIVITQIRGLIITPLISTYE